MNDCVFDLSRLACLVLYECEFQCMSRINLQQLGNYKLYSIIEGDLGSFRCPSSFKFLLKMQQQVWGSSKYTPIPKVSTARYSPRKTTENDKELSPWNNDEHKRIFRPNHFYDTINHPPTHSKGYKMPISGPRVRLEGVSAEHNNLMGGRLSKDFIQLVRLQKKGAYLPVEERRNENPQLHLNLISVNLDQAAYSNYSPPKTQRRTLDQFTHRQHSLRDEIQKDQPVRVRIFKKIKEKNRQSEDQEERSTQLPSYDFRNLETSEGRNVYPAMPSRNPKTILRHKPNSSIEVGEVFPQITSENLRRVQSTKKQDYSEITCRGWLIARKQGKKGRNKVRLG